jgi:hypothetical protein
MKEYTSPLEPHFDDDRTLRSAQPVVPLEQINKKVRHRRQWFLGGAFAIAMVLGAASALLASYLKLRHTPTAVTEVAEDPEIAPAPVPVTETMAATAPDPDEAEAAETTESLEPATTPKKESPPRHRTVVVKRNPQPVELRDPRMSEAEELQRIRQAVLVDEWQERRARRVERRERRRWERYNNHRDLSNVDEIFEGRRRPN